MSEEDSIRVPRLPACQACAQKKTKCDSARPKCSSCSRNGVECIVINSSEGIWLSRAAIDELERKEQALSLRFRALEADTPTTNPPQEDQRPEEIHSVKPLSQPVSREGGPSFIELLFANPDWRKSHAGLLRTLSSAPRAAEACIAPCPLPSCSEARHLFEIYLSWSHVQNPFLLRREVWALHGRLFPAGHPCHNATSPDLFRAFMLCAIASVLPYRNGTHHQHPEGYYHSALQHFDSDFLTRGVDSVQDLLLVSRFGIYHQIGTSIWDIIRLCGRLCIELGLHSRDGESGDLLQIQRNRRVFWQFYMIDRYSSTTLDRPFLIDDSDIEIDLPADADDDELEAADPSLHNLDSFISSRNRDTPNDMTVSLVSLRLRKISSHIHTEFSRLRHEPQAPHLMSGHVHVVMDNLLQELDNWRNNTPLIPQPKCLYETQEWYDLLQARERLYVMRRAIDLVPKHNGCPPKHIANLFLRSALETIERYYSLCQHRSLITHTRSYFHTIFTAGLSVIFCISVLASIEETKLQEAFQSLSRCQETLVSMATQLPDAQCYVAVFEALYRDISRKRLEVHDGIISRSSNDGFVPNGTFTNAQLDAPRPPTTEISTNATATALPAQIDNSLFYSEQSSLNSNFETRNEYFEALNPGGILSDAGSMAFQQQPLMPGDSIDWTLVDYDSFWNMGSAIGEYVCGDPATSGIWEGLDF